MYWAIENAKKVVERAKKWNVEKIQLMINCRVVISKLFLILLLGIELKANIDTYKISKQNINTYLYRQKK